MWHHVTQGSTNQVWPHFQVTFYLILKLSFSENLSSQFFQFLTINFKTILMKVKVPIWYCTQVKIIIIWIPLSLSNLIIFQQYPSSSQLFKGLIFGETWWYWTQNIHAAGETRIIDSKLSINIQQQQKQVTKMKGCYNYTGNTTLKVSTTKTIRYHHNVTLKKVTLTKWYCSILA